MRYARRIAFCLIAALSGRLAFGAFEPFPFPLSHESPDNVVSMRGLLDAPDGTSFVRVDPSYRTLWYEIEVAETRVARMRTVPADFKFEIMQIGGGR